MNQKRIFLFTLLLFCTACFSQPVNMLSDSSQQRLRNFSVLTDSNYSFQQILTDSNIVFVPTQRLEPNESRVYWIKLVIDNPSQYSGRYSIFHHPFIDNTVFCYDQDAKRWMESRAGVLAPGRVRRYGISTCMLQGGARNTIYIKADIKGLGRLNHFVKASFMLEKETITRQQELQSWILCIAIILVVLIFLVYNAIIFFSIRDRAYLYYLLIQAGGIFYIAANFQCFHYLIPWQGFSSMVSPGGIIYYFHLNLFIQRLATITILTGYVQLTRNYLQTRAHLPKLDQLLKWLIVVFAVFELVHNTISLTGIKYLDIYVNLYSNIGIAAIILGILVTAVAAKLRRVYAAGYFLWANLATLALMMCLALYYIIAPNGSRNMWLPCACIVMQALMFAIALVARLRLVRETLADKQSEAAQLKTDIEQLVAKQDRLTAEYEQIQAHILHEKNRNETLEQQLGANQRELASAVLYMTQKNELLARLRSQVQELSQLLPRGNKALKDIEANLQHNQFLDNDWEKFRLHFENVHPRFFEELRSKYPRLTQNEVRLCAYFHMNLATKEIAGLLNIDPASVRRAKTRLNKKMNGALVNKAA